MDSQERNLRCEIITVCRKLEAKGLIAASDGNVSCRAGEGRILITPGGVAKGDMEAGDLVTASYEGELLEGTRKPSSEIKMHLHVYRNRPDVFAVVHAHPPMVTAFTLVGFPFNSKVLPEVWLSLGNVPTAPYATPSTDEVPQAIAPHVGRSNAILLRRHGALTFGSSVMQAYMRMEKLEHAAKIFCYASVLEDRKCPAVMADNEIKKLEGILK
ncbi:MAG: class II aldolase/adducin family protein [Desulfobacteraceae bacterium]|nr:class II aldolase/adducin family protein [Desulfobacteraceae bacterium]